VGTDRYFGLLSQEFGRFTHGVDEGSLREKWDLIRGHVLIVIVLREHPTADGAPFDSLTLNPPPPLLITPPVPRSIGR